VGVGTGDGDVIAEELTEMTMKLKRVRSDVANPIGA